VSKTLNQGIKICLGWADRYKKGFHRKDNAKDHHRHRRVIACNDALANASITVKFAIKLCTSYEEVGQALCMAMVGSMAETYQYLHMIKSGNEICIPLSTTNKEQVEVLMNHIKNGLRDLASDKETSDIVNSTPVVILAYGAFKTKWPC
jgi:hypothetical protein